MTQPSTSSVSPNGKPLISIVYHSGSGHTEQMSRAVAKGALALGDVEVIEHQIVDSDFSGGRW